MLDLDNQTVQSRNTCTVATRPLRLILSTIEEEDGQKSMQTQDTVSQSLKASSQRRIKLNRHDIWTSIRSVPHHQAYNKQG
jgi:ABC-type Fe3+-citrate transport system substrate-binding protein